MAKKKDSASQRPGARELTDEERAKLAELDAQLAKYEEQKRWSDVIRTILAKAEIVVAPDDKAELMRLAGSMYVDKSSNQAEAIKCYEQVLELRGFDFDAVGRLKEMYEKRRDWERLLKVMELEVEQLDPAERAPRFVEMAEIATTKLRKPEVCIELWKKVLESDPAHAAALSNLASMYERAREWQPLAGVLEQLVESLTDTNELKTQLQKLGMIYADKIGDDSGAVRAFRRLLTLDPDDKRAQEQLKKRYVALKQWNELEELYEGTDKWDELIRMLERESDNKDLPDEEKIGILFRIARLWEQKKQKADRAARAYEKVLEADPNNLNAAEALTPIYEGANDAKKLVGVYEVRLKHVDDPEPRIQLLRETGVLYEERLRQPETAFAKFLEAFGIAPQLDVIREDVARLADATKGWDKVVEAYVKAIDGATDGDTVIELRMGFGAILQKIERPEDAIKQYQAVLDGRPDQTEAIAALGDLYRTTKRFEGLLDIYDRRIDLESDVDAKKALAYERAALFENELANPAKGIAGYEAILEEYGDGEIEAYRSLDRLFDQQQRWNDLARTLERRISLGPESDEELASLKYRLGNCQEMHLNDKLGAVELYREVLILVPEHDGAREALEQLLPDHDVGGSAASILEPIYESRGDWERLVRALRVLHRVAEDRESRLEILTKIAEVYGERVQDPAKCFGAFAEALKEAPDSEATLARLEVLAVEQEKFPALVQLLSELAKGTTDPTLGRTLWVKAAEIQDGQLGDVDGAVDSYQRVLGIDPGDAGVLNALEALFRRTERWRDLVGVIRRRVEITNDPTEKEELLSQVAGIHDGFLEDAEEAIRLNKEILEIDPGSQRALAALDDLYARQQKWSELADNVDRQLLMAEEPAEQIRLMLRLADLREKRMGAVDAAIEMYREVLERQVSNGPALAALERLLQAEPHQVLIAGILEPIYREANEFQKLIAVHEIQARNASSPERRVELLHQIAELQEMALDDLDGAFKSYARALAEDPGSLASQEQLERMTRVTGDVEALARVYETQVTEVQEAPLAAALHMKAAKIREEQLNDHERAIAHYRRVLELDESSLEAATSLERLYQLAERYEELAAIYLVKAKMLERPEEQKEYFYRAASIFEEFLERPLDSIQIYQQILEVDPEDMRSIDKLIEVFLRLERWEDLLKVYEKKADVTFDTEEKKTLYIEVGAVYERELGNVERAIDVYQRILEIDPEDLTAIGRLDALYQATQNWRELLSVLEREADLATDPNEVISYRYRIAELWHRRLDDRMRAVEIYREILEVIPEHDPTRAALEGMIQANEEPVAAAGVLEPVYRQGGEWEKLIRVHEVQIAHESDPVRKVELLHQVAELFEMQLDQAQQAFAAYARALPVDNRNEQTMQSLERLAELTGGWAEVARLYDVEIAKLRNDSPEDVIEAAMRTGAIYEVQLDDVNSAIDRYRIALEVDVSHVPSIEALDRLYEATERWAELADILEKEIAVAPSPDDVLRLQFRLGQLYQSYLNDVGRAIERYREILAAAPEHTQAASALELLFAEGVEPLVIGEVLEPLYRMNEQWDRLLNVHEIQLHYQDSMPERVSMMHRIAEIAEERASDHARAFLWMQRALLEDPAHDHTLGEVERLGTMLDAWPQLASTYADGIVGATNPASKVELARRLARVYEEELGDVARAEEAYRFLVGVDPRNEEALAALDRIYAEHGSHEALADVLKRRIAATEHKDDRVALSYRLGQVLERDLGRTEEAITTYRRILGDLEPEHAETINALEGIYLRLEDWPNLFGTLEKELDVAMGDGPQSEILAKMARIGANRLGDSEKAIGLWRRVLDLRGEDAEALNELGNIYAEQGNWKDLVEILEREVSIVEDDETKVAIYSDLGRIWYVKLGRERNALESWERVLDIQPQNVDALQHVAEIYRAGKQWHELVDTLLRIVSVGAAVLEDTQLVHVYMQLGHLYDTELRQPMDAVEAYRSALEVRPQDLTVMAALETILRREAMWEDTIDVMSRRAEALEDPAAKIDQLVGVAHMWAEEANDTDKGTGAYQRILEIEPLHDYAFRRLEQLHRDAERWEDLIELYLGRVEATDDSEVRVELLRKVARVYEEKLDDLGEAFDALQIAWAVNYKNRETAIELERVTAATKKWNDLLGTANAALQDVEDPTVKIAICLWCAKWYGQELAHPEYAIPYYQQILQLDPSNVPAMRQMADLYETTQQWESMAQVLGRLVDMTADTTIQADTYVRMGVLAEDHLGIPDQAGQYFEKAVDLDGRNVRALEALERMQRGRGNWKRLLEILHQKADALTDAKALEETRIQIAETYEDRTQDVEKAIGSYRQALDLNDKNLQALKGLERLYSQTERWQELLAILETEYEVVTTERERISILLRLAGMWEEEFVKPEKAAERLEQVIEIDPNHEAALGSLARIYRGLQRWDALIDTYERHINATPDRGEKIRLFKAEGQVFAGELANVDRAIDAYLNVLQVDDRDAQSLDELAKLYEKREDHSSALEMMERLVRQVTDPTQQVDLKFRMGHILDTFLGDRTAALDAYEGATDLDPGHLASLEAMRKIHVDGGDWSAAAKVLEREAEHTASDRVVAERLVELGKILEEKLDEHDAAIEVFERAYAKDADSEDAALPLVNEYFEKERYGDAYPLLDMLVKRSAKREPKDQHRLAFMLGRAAIEVREIEEAIKAYGRAYQLDSADLPSLIGLADAYYQAKDWEKAFKYYQMLLVHQREALDRDQTTDIFYRLGVIKREQGERRKALNMFDKALEEDQHHRPTLLAVIGMYEEGKEWEQVIHFKKLVLDVAEDDEERFKLLDDIGDLWKDKLKNHQKAIQSWVDATTIKPEAHVVLHKLLGAYQETKQWEKAIEIIQHIADLDDRPPAKGKYLYTIGVILRDEMKDTDAAVEKFNEALDVDFEQLKAFEAINKVHNTKKDWKGLERAYRKMLHRLVNKGKDDLEFGLWHTLGLIYRDRQKNYEAAAQSFQMAASKKPEDPTQHQILSELYGMMPERVNDAIAEHQWLLRNDPYRVDSYRALYKLYFEARAYDKAWCLAATLSYLKKADAEQEQFYTQYRQQGPIRPQARVDNERWVKDLFHPDEDLYVSKIMEILAPAIHGLKATTDKALNLHKLKPVDLATSTVTLARTFGFVLQVLNIQLQPRLFFQQTSAGGLSNVVGSNPPAIISGATLLQGYSPQDLAFICGRHLAYYRPEHFVRTMLPGHSELRAILLAALRIAGISPADPQVDSTAQQIVGRLTPAQVDALRGVARKFVEAGGSTDVKLWMQRVELTAIRAGFLVCNDLETSARMVQALMPEGTADLPPKEKVKELVLFSVSEGYFRLREALGIQIQV